MKYDFGGWATRNDLQCADGRVIKKDAFKGQNGQTVPLVWMHNHADPANVLGLAHLENRDEGVYAFCEFNDTESGKTARELVKHGDVQSLSIFVKESEAMIINVGIGRAWFNHTWTLNDALLPLVVPQSEILLNRYDAVVLEVDSREAVRANDIKIIKGTPASNPMKPTMVKTNDRWQYPLAYIYVGAGVTSIRQANITNCVGTSECPFVTAPLDKVEIDDLIAQWQDQWKEFYEKQTTDMEETNKFWKEQWSTWFLAQTEEIQSAYLTWEAQWNIWYSEHTADMEATSTYWKEKWEAWFNEYTSINTAEMADWKQKSETEFREWFDQLQALLDSNTAASLAKKLLELQEQVDVLNQFSSNLENEYTVYQKLYDNGYRTYGDVLDSSDASITDSNLDTVIGRTYSSDLLRDSNGDVIEGRAIFVIK